MSKLYERIGTSTPDSLLEDPQGSDIIAIACEPGNGIAKRGTVMYRKASGMYAPAGAAEAVATNYLVVLNETVDTDADATVAADAAAYRGGRLIASRVKLKDDAELTSAVIAVLRGQGIVLGQLMEEAAEFNNSTEA